MPNLTLEQRMEKLEKELALSRRRFRYLLAGVIALALAAIICWKPMETRATGEPTEIRAKSFLLIDDKGGMRGAWLVASDGPELDLFDENGTQIAQFSATSATTGPSSPASSCVESSIDGEFNGWEGETVVQLMNGQIWQQTDFYYWFYYAYMPKVLIYRSGAGWKMHVNGVDHDVEVKRLK